MVVPAQRPAPEPKQIPIVTSGLSLAPILALPVLSVEQPPLPAAPKIEERPTQIENAPEFQTSPRPRRLEAVEQPAPEVTVTTEVQTAEPVELKPIASPEPRFRVAPPAAATLAVPISAPSKIARRATPSGFGVIAVFVVLTVVITGLVLILRKRLAGRPHRLPLNSDPRPSFSPSQTAVRAAPSIPGLDALRWDQFELVVAETYRREDFIVEISAGLDAEGGTDLTLRRESETFLVQCSHWQAASIAEREVREFYGMMAATGAPQGIIATLGTFTREAQTFAAEKGIELLDRAALEKRIAEAARPDEDFCAVGDWIDDFTSHARIFDPECPVCNRSMVIRQSRVGGASMWGCRSYPRCPGKREPRMELITVGAGR
jgi:hypothetical protein